MRPLAYELGDLIYYWTCLRGELGQARRTFSPKARRISKGPSPNGPRASRGAGVNNIKKIDRGRSAPPVRANLCSLISPCSIKPVPRSRPSTGRVRRALLRAVQGGERGNRRRYGRSSSRDAQANRGTSIASAVRPNCLIEGFLCINRGAWLQKAEPSTRSLQRLQDRFRSEPELTRSRARRHDGNSEGPLEHLRPFGAHFAAAARAEEIASARCCDSS